MATLLQWGLVNGILVTVLAVGVALVSRCLKRPALTHALWLIVLIKVLTPPIVEWRVAVPIPEGLPPHRALMQGSVLPRARLSADSAPLPLSSAGQPRSVPTPSTPPGISFTTLNAAFRQAARETVLGLCSVWREYSAHIFAVLGLIWFGGMAVWVGRQFCQAQAFYRQLADYEPASGKFIWHAERLARSMGLRSLPRIVTVPHVISPMLCGIGPFTRLVLPQPLLERLPVDAGRTLLAHELAHYARGDHWVRVLELLATAVFWWHPVVWWARKEIEISEEECCDAWVVGEFPNGSRTYAEALLATIDFLADHAAPLPPAATGVAQYPFLRQRLTQIMRGVAPKSLSVPGRLGVLFLAATLLPFSVTFSRAQATDRPRSRTTVRTRVVDSRKSPQSTRKAQKIVSPHRPAAVPVARPVEFERPAAPRVIANRDPDPPDVPEAPTEPESPWAIAVSHDGRFQITQRSAASITLHDAESGRSTDLSAASILAVAFSPGGRTFATGGSDRLVRIWDSETGQILATFQEHQHAVPTLGFTPDGEWLISGSSGGDVHIWNVFQSDRSRTLRLRQTPIDSLSVSRDGRWLAVATQHRFGLTGGRITIRDLATLSERHSFAVSSAVGAVAFHEDGMSVVVGETNGRITFWNLHSGQPTAVGFVPRDVISAARFSTDTHALSRMDPNAVLPVAPIPKVGPPVPRGVIGNLLPDEHRDDREPAVGEPVPEKPLRTQGV